MSAEGSSSDAAVPLRQLAIYAAGFNAFSQLDASTTEDSRVFRPISVPSDCFDSAGHAVDLDILLATWSTTVLAVLETRDRIATMGFQRFRMQSTSLTGDETSFQAPVSSAVGDHNGMTAFVDASGRLFVLKSQQRGPTASSASTERSPIIEHIALATNERVVVTTRLKPDDEECSMIQEFETFQDFMSWYQDPSNASSASIATHKVSGKPKQLLANAASFLLLTQGGEVYSWGDPRHKSLGRLIIGEGSVPASRPGVVDAVGGLRITKIASGGWMSAALSEDGAAYLWGAAYSPGHQEHGIKCLREAGAGEVVLVEILDSRGEPADIIDIAIGDGHVAVVTAPEDGNRLYVLGHNRNGQLGVDSPDHFIEDWREVVSMRGAHRVVCGPKATFCFCSVP